MLIVKKKKKKKKRKRAKGTKFSSSSASARFPSDTCKKINLLWSLTGFFKIDQAPWEISQVIFHCLLYRQAEADYCFACLIHKRLAILQPFNQRS